MNARLYANRMRIDIAHLEIFVAAPAPSLFYAHGIHPRFLTLRGLQIAYLYRTSLSTFRPFSIMKVNILATCCGVY